MKKYLLFFAVLWFLPMTAAADYTFEDSNTFSIARAVKLGRDRSYSNAGNSTVDSRNTGSELSEAPQAKSCDVNCSTCDTKTGKCSKCKTGRYLYDNMCMVCPANATCNGTDTFSCAAQYRKNTRECTANCTGVSCKSGYTATSTASGCCCELTSCPSGQRLSGTTCVSNCSGVSCKSGYKAVSTAAGCCCEVDRPVCAAGQIYNTTIKKCVAAVCPMGCLDSCVNGCGSCQSGRYLNYNDGYCPTCSSAIANCKTCTSSSSGAKCTACNTGYTLSGGSCVVSVTQQPMQCDGVNAVPLICPNGMTRTSRGCCPAGATASQACLQCAVR